MWTRSEHPHSPGLDRRQFLSIAALAGAGGALPLLHGCGDDEATTPTVTRVMPALPPLPGFAPPVSEPVVRVRIHRVRKMRTTLSLGQRGRWVLVRDMIEDAHGHVLQAPLTCTYTTDGWTIRGHDRQVRNMTPDAHVMCTPMIHHDITCNGRTYPDRLMLVPIRRDDAPLGVDVINHVPIETYLPGVLKAELYSHWPLETFRAQAVAARSFAASEHLYFRDRRHYDLTSTTRSQVYVGLTSDSKPIRAVRETVGQLLTMVDARAGATDLSPRLVPGYYSSCCGGLAAQARDAIGDHEINTLSALDGHEGVCPCDDSPRHRWTVRRMPDVLARRLHSACGVDAGPVRSIAVAQRNPHGRPSLFTIDDADGGAHHLPASRMRTALNHTSRNLPEPDGTAWSSSLEGSLNGRHLHVAGEGFGHGVGMCQYGARALADRGWSMPRMLEWYYPGAEVRQHYDDAFGRV